MNLTGFYLSLYFDLRSRFSIKFKVQCCGTWRVFLLTHQQGHHCRQNKKKWKNAYCIMRRYAFISPHLKSRKLRFLPSWADPCSTQRGQNHSLSLPNSAEDNRKTNKATHHLRDGWRHGWKKNNHFQTSARCCRRASRGVLLSDPSRVM